MSLRRNIAAFELANPVYVGATVSFYTVDGSGNKTTTFATLYDATSGTSELVNPQLLDSDGKFAQPVYVETAVIGSVTGLSIADHDTGIINVPGKWRGVWVTATVYYAGEVVSVSSLGGNIYVCEVTHTSGTFATDLSNGDWSLYIDVGIIEGHRATAAGMSAYAAMSAQKADATVAGSQAAAQFQAAIATSGHVAYAAMSAQIAKAQAGLAEARAQFQALMVSGGAVTMAYDAVKKAIASKLAAAASASAASTSETNAGTSATNALANETAAKLAADRVAFNAALSVHEAKRSAASAAASADSATTAAASAASVPSQEGMVLAIQVYS